MTRRNRSDLFIERSREMRQQPNDAEAMVWNALRNRQLRGFKFRRQYAIGNFIVDFYCAEARLVIELDGKSHEGREEYDTTRDAWLRSQDLDIVRVPNLELTGSIDEFLHVVWLRCVARVGDVSRDAGPSP